VLAPTGRAMKLVGPETREFLLSIPLLPCYGIGYAAGWVVRIARLMWTAVVVGYREASGGRQPVA